MTTTHPPRVPAPSSPEEPGTDERGIVRRIVDLLRRVPALTLIGMIRARL